MFALDGIRVLDFTWLFAGPWGTRQLAALGAEVIRIEWRDNLDFLRTLQTIPVPGHKGDADDAPRTRSVNRSAFYNNTNSGKLGMALNVKHPQGTEIFRQLVAASDVVIENFSAGVLKSWGFGYPELRSIRDDIIYVQLPGFGNEGPYSSYRAYGLINQAFSGLTY